MSLINIDAIGGKVANEGATEQGILSSTNWNLLVSAVKELQNVSMVSVTPSTNPTASVVNVNLSIGKGNESVVQCTFAIPSANESTAGVFTPALLTSLKNLIEAARQAGANAMTKAQNVESGLDNLGAKVGKAVVYAFPAFANSNAIIETSEAFAERQLDDDKYLIIQNITCGGVNYVAWSRRDGADDAPIDSIVVFQVLADGTTRTSCKPLPEELEPEYIQNLTGRVETLEATKYTYTLQGIYESPVDVENPTPGLYYFTEENQFENWEYKRPRPGAAVGWVRKDVEVYDEALFICGNKVYKYDGEELSAVGSSLEIGEVAGTAFDGGRGKAVEDSNREHHSIRFGGIVQGDITFQQVGVTNVIPSEVYYSEQHKQFVVKRDGKYYNSWDTRDEWIHPHTNSPYSEKQYILNNNLYMYDATEGLKQVGGSSIGSIFNATNEVPISGFYVLCDTENTGISAVHAAWNAKKAVGGLIISFEIGAGIWKTYQFIGKTVNEINWFNTESWKDFGS